MANHIGKNSSQNLSFAAYNGEFKKYWRDENRKTHGGVLSIGRRKTRRPLSTKKPLHLVMRSDVAYGAMSLRKPKNYLRTQRILKKYAGRFGVRIYHQSINSNHIHMVVRAKTRKSFQDFLRTAAGLIARQMLAAEKGRKSDRRFWATLAFTRISEWGRAFRALKDYVTQNILEAAGVIAYTPRKGRQTSLRSPMLYMSS